MSSLLPLTVAVPLICAAGLAAVSSFLPRRIPDLVALLAAIATVGISAAILVDANSHTLLHWFGGWRPRGEIALGISFAVDPVGAGLALLAAVLVTAAMLFSWSYFDDPGHHFQVLILVFLGAMCGFALSGDLFNMFVWFELMGVAAYTLTGYRSEEGQSLQGALNFAIVNSIGGFMVLFGTALLYARTGALNLAQIGAVIGDRQPHGVVVVAFLLLACGFLVKAAVVPFHFWLADAHAVAPASVCVLLSGVMVELGLYAVGRSYWTIFAGSLGRDAHALQVVLLTVGCATALLGAVMAFLQRHLKRLLAYSTISHSGLFLVGLALLNAKGLASAAAGTLAHGLSKGSLFLAVGILLYCRGSVDELRLRGKGRGLPLTGLTFLLGAVALSGLPPFGVYLDHSLLEEGGREAGFAWIALVVLVASIVSNAAIFRAAGRVYLGLGAAEDPLLSPEPDESSGDETERGPHPWLMAVPMTALALAGFGLSLAPGLETLVHRAGERFVDRPAYIASVLHGSPSPGGGSALDLPAFALSSVLYGVAATAGAAALAAFALYRPRLGPGPLLARPLDALRAVHSGHVGDYVAWLVFGVAALGAAFAATLR